MLGKEIPELMKMLVKEKREESLDLKGMGAHKTAKESFVSNFWLWLERWYEIWNKVIDSVANCKETILLAFWSLLYKFQITERSVACPGFKIMSLLKINDGVKLGETWFFFHLY